MNIYPYGSRVYNTAQHDSDHDFVIVSSDEQFLGAINSMQASYNNKVDFNIYTAPEWQKKLDRHDIDALECHFLDTPVVNMIKFDFELDLQQLRRSISEKANHSWVKAKKKMVVERDFDTGLKSLFHSLRILMFGIQIAHYGKLMNYKVANHYWNQIENKFDYQQMNLWGDAYWDNFSSEYKSEFNRLATEFRKLAPKEIQDEA